MSTEETMERIKYLEKQIGVLMDLLGFCGYPTGFIQDNDERIQMVISGYHKLNREKLPVKSKDFNLLLKYLKLEIQDEKTERKIIKLTPFK